MVKTVKREIKLVSIKRKSFSDPVKGVKVARRIISSGQNCVEIFLWRAIGLCVVMEWPKWFIELDQQFSEDTIFTPVGQYQRLPAFPDDFVSSQELNTELFLQTYIWTSSGPIQLQLHKQINHPRVPFLSFRRNARVLRANLCPHSHELPQTRWFYPFCFLQRAPGPYYNLSHNWVLLWRI